METAPEHIDENVRTRGNLIYGAPTAQLMSLLESWRRSRHCNFKTDRWMEFAFGDKDGAWIPGLMLNCHRYQLAA